MFPTSTTSQLSMLVTTPTMVGVSTIVPPITSGLGLSVLNPASDAERSLFIVIGRSAESFRNLILMESDCLSPAMPSKSTEVIHFPASAPSLIFVKSSFTTDGLLCEPVAKSILPATPERLPSMPSIRSAVLPVGSTINVSRLICCFITTLKRYSRSFSMVTSCTAVKNQAGLPLIKASCPASEDADTVAVVPSTVMPSAGL